MSTQGQALARIQNPHQSPPGQQHVGFITPGRGILPARAATTGCRARGGCQPPESSQPGW